MSPPWQPAISCFFGHSFPSCLTQCLNRPLINIYQKVREWILFQPPLGDRNVCCVPRWGFRCQSLNFTPWALHLMERVGRPDPSCCWLNETWRQEERAEFLPVRVCRPRQCILGLLFSYCIPEISPTERGEYLTCLLFWFPMLALLAILSREDANEKRQTGALVPFCLLHCLVSIPEDATQTFICFPGPKLPLDIASDCFFLKTTKENQALSSTDKVPGDSEINISTHKSATNPWESIFFIKNPWELGHYGENLFRLTPWWSYSVQGLKSLKGNKEHRAISGLVRGENDGRIELQFREKWPPDLLGKDRVPASWADQGRHHQHGSLWSLCNCCSLWAV